ncbi:translation initiation factor IF-3 [Spiroplasma endosymbiont of Aspidapion aeneum]|uniref:translation initiation factor IF-3 n=1 Tax=Spiroplasma endosymbiont of Aspidapion aeneum TaxID=3066276 RepID=UPI00313C6750
MVEEREKEKGDIVNGQIRAFDILIIEEDGSKVGPLQRSKALEYAREKNLDLLQVGHQDKKTAIAKILDYGKFKYEQKRKAKVNKQKQVKVENKEIRLTVSIGAHDMDTKARKAREFLESGDRVKISLKFKGREITHFEYGQETLNKFFSRLEDIAKIEKEAKLTSRFLDMYIVPKKDK